MSYFAGSARNGEIVRAEAASLVVVVALDLWLVPRFGATGGAITASIAYAVSSSIMTYRFVTITGSRWADLILVSPEEVSRLANARSAAVARLSRFRLRWT